MLDTVTLRVVFVMVASCALVLFAVTAYGATRARYSAWWCASLLLAAVSTTLFLLNGTALQVIANPAGNAVGSLSALCIWGSIRSLTGRRLPRRILAGVPAFVLAVALLDDPANDLWTGGEVFLLAMALGFGGAAVEAGTLHRGARRSVSRSDEAGYDDSQYRVSVLLMASGTAATAAFYVARTVAMVIWGRDGEVFLTVFGPQPATLLMIALMVIAVYSMSTFSRAQYVARLRREASRDALTGLFNRRQFLRRVEFVQRHGRRDVEWVLALADLDRLKQLNDVDGHAAGDRALATVGSVVAGSLLHGELAGRIGGDEFALLLGTTARAEEVADAVNAGLAEATQGLTDVSVSLGVAEFDPDLDIEEMLERADRAMYLAKADGGRRLHVDGGLTDVPDSESPVSLR
ncbi:GGDEF domain-containing protein [Nocardioides sp. GY 10113]|uniref:GGDEF domain-containing protein n=1 Tax=Nocardioides sp. GY 10113 TaxID=2569761 RepID=UPI0010A82FA4|nr:GGDEF domain-containing protein [Nocardioides sp. GY 10113]TIC79608.1 GGDEF domain-containing protein [Nocardioides sp. GY 10113]TIC79645.1 GGDEF domain-containing protein [Nocardioides sp. GY 10113]